MSKVAIIGCGFVGLSLSVFLAARGIKVIGVDIDQEKVKQLNSGKPTFFEQNLQERLKEGLNKELEFSTDILNSVKNSDIIFICVGTPSNTDGTINLDFVKEAIEQVGRSIKDSKKEAIIVVKSTVVPTTTNKIIKPILENSSAKKVGKDLGLVMNPEFLREGSAIHDTENPHLIVIGSNEDKYAKNMRVFYQKLYEQNMPEIIQTNIETAEMIKYANNAFLATKISFINTIANICQKIPGTDVNIIAKAIGKDPRIGPLFLHAGPGYGGSCFPKDVSALINFSKNIGYDPILINATKRVNDLQVEKVLELIENQLGKISGKTISVLGLSFKKDTDDIRESISIKILSKILEKGGKIVAHDPMAIKNASEIFKGQVKFQLKIEECVKDSDCCVIMTDWDEYKKLEPTFFKSMKELKIIDARRILDLEKFNEFTMSGIGRG